MSLRPSALACALLLAAGCAAHPERPDTGTSGAPAAAAASAHLFDGCTVESVDRTAFLLKCDTLLASLKIAKRTTREQLIEGTLMGMKALGYVRATDGKATVGGVERDAKMVQAFDKPTDASPKWTGKVVALGDATHGSRVIICGAFDDAGATRCPAMLTWLSTHDAPPPGVPAAGTAASAPAWPPESALHVLAGCKRLEAPAGAVYVRCGETVIALARLGRPAGDETAYDRFLVQWATKDLAGFRRTVAADAKLTYLDCRLGGHKASCARMRAKTKDGEIEVLKAVGTLFDAAAVMQCKHVVTSTELPKECAAFMEVGGERPAPTLGPAPAATPPAGASTGP